MRQIRALFWGDFLTHTGFGEVLTPIVNGLYAKGDYDISVLAINYHGDRKHNYPFTVYPTDTKNWLGTEKLFKLLREEKYDIVFLFNDLPLITDMLPTAKNISPQTKFVCYFPIDSYPVQPNWYRKLKSHSDYAITYTQFGVEAFKKFKSDFFIDTLPHAVDTSLYYPLTEEQILDLKKNKWKSWDNMFIVCNVNRFSLRKNFEATLRAYNIWYYGYKICSKCGNWYNKTLDKCDLNDCNEGYSYESPSREGQSYLYLHSETYETWMGTREEDSLTGHVYANNFHQRPSPVKVMQPNRYFSQQYDDKWMNELYNVMDVCLNTASAEGWSLSVSHSLATGTSVIVPNHSSLPEVVPCESKGVHLVDNVYFFSGPNEVALQRKFVDVRGVVHAIEQEYQKWLANKRKKVIYSEHIDFAKQITHTQLVDKLDTIFKKVLSEKPAQIESKINKVLVVREIGGIGDMLCITPSLYSLQRKYPNAEVTITVPQNYMNIFENDFKVVDLKKLNADDYDKVINLSSPCPAAIYESQSLPKVLFNRIEIFASKCQIRLETDKPIYTIKDDEKNEAKRVLNKYMNGGNLVGIQLHTAETYRDYPYFPRVVKKLIQEKNVSAVLLFTDRDIDIVKIYGDSDKIISVNAPLRLSVALMNECDVVISPDSAFVHYCAALNKPNIALFGPIGVYERLKTYKYAVPLVADSCPYLPCWRNQATKCYLTNQVESFCMGEIMPEKVVEETLKILKVKD